MSRLLAATVVHLGGISQISGPQDLDLDGEFIYAINFSTDDPARTVHGVKFSPDRLKIPGATLVGPQFVTPWQNKPEFGSSNDANQLEEILRDIRWANTAGGEKLRATLAVTPAEEYKLQILISGNITEDRRWDIRVNGKNAVDEITSLGASPGQRYAVNRATLYTYQFVAATPNVVVEMGTLFGATDGGDRNPIWQALTLERITIPPTPADLVLDPGDGQFFASQTAAIGRFRAIDQKGAVTHGFALVPGDGDEDNARFNLEGADLIPRRGVFSAQPAGSRYSIRVRAADTGDANRFLEKRFQLTIASPHAPGRMTFDAGSIDATARSGALMAKISVDDPDAFDRHELQLVDGPNGDHNGFFRITGNNLILVQPLPDGLSPLKLRLRATDLAGLSLETMVTLPALAPRLRINEFLSGEVGGYADESGNKQGWIELHNELPQWVELAGWHLTDDRNTPRKWPFPHGIIGPQGFLLVLADGLGTTPVGSSQLHANFSLSGSGEWLALVKKDGTTLASQLDPPEQFPGISYGYPDPADSKGSVAYLKSPTPAASNAAAFTIGRNEVALSHPHGFYGDKFSLQLTASVPGSIIRYTLDGSRPGASSGLVYGGPISIAPSTSGTTRGTRIVRAIALHPAAAYAPVATQTYLFINGSTNPLVDGVVAQSQLTVSITRNAVYAPVLADAFLALPAVSVVLPGGIAGVENPGSIELFDPANREPGFQIDAGIQSTGTSSLGSPKLSMAATFRREYGTSELNYPMFAQGSMFPRGAASKFKELRLRSHSHDTFYWLGTRENPPLPYGNPPVNRSGDAQLARNPWIDEMQLMMGQPGKHGRQVHLYLNGAYHGIYHIHEHPDEDFMASYFPGGRSDFHFTGGATTGSDHGPDDSWTTPWRALKLSLANYTQAQRWIDVTNLCDSMLLSFYAGNDWDWSAQHNWGAAGPSGPDRGGWKFFQQDSDVTLQDVAADCTDQDVPDGIFTALMRFSDFRVLFRDRVYRHCYNNGALTPARAGGLYQARMLEISNAIVAETARWQPSSSVAKLPWDRDQEWINEWNYLKNTFFPQRTTRLIEQLRKHSGWWPVNPPGFTVPAGRVAVGAAITITNQVGTVYFTTDGTDPRLPGGKISPRARTLTPGPLLVTEPLLVRARVFASSDWSALVEVFYLPEGIPAASPSHLLLTEIHYHPLEEAAPEFVELQNTSASSLDLSGVTLADAVHYVIPSGTVLAYGERIVITRDPALFQAVYRSTNSPYFHAETRFLGPWEGSLSNGGETLTLLAADGAPLFSCTYGTAFPWPVRADGMGSSLELKESSTIPETAPARTAWLNDARHWRPSELIHGSPGVSGVNAQSKVVLNEVLASPIPPETDAIELVNRWPGPVSIGGWFLSDRLKNLRKYRFPADTVLLPAAWHVLRETDFNGPANPACLIPFALDGDGDGLYLVEADIHDHLIRFVDQLDFGSIPRGATVGRSPDGTGRWALLNKPTLGAVNSAVAPGYDAWRVTAFPSGTTSSDTLRDADPDGDQRSNFAEYAFVLSPLDSDAPPLAPLGVFDDSFQFSCRIRTVAPDVAYRFEVSENLVDWDRNEGALEVLSRIASDDGSTSLIVRLRSMAVAGDSRRFVRVTLR